MTLAIALLAAAVLALFWCVVSLHRQLTAAVLVQRYGSWVKSSELRAICGPAVYGSLRSLVRRGLAERCEAQAGSPEQREAMGGRPAYWYRASGGRRE